MQNNNIDSKIIWMGIVVFVIFCWIVSLGNQNSNLKKQVGELKAQIQAYDDCVSQQRNSINNLSSTITKAKNSLNSVQNYNDVYANYRNIEDAQNTLNTRLPSFDCAIPDSPDVPTPTP